MEVADCRDGLEAVFKGGEGGGLGEEHEDAVEGFVEVGVECWFEELEAEVYKEGCWLVVGLRFWWEGGSGGRTGEDWGF